MPKATPFFPMLTLAALGMMGALAIAQYIYPPIIPALQRQPSMVEEGEYWRFLTALLVQRDGAAQIAFNLPLLAGVGFVAERLWGRTAWIAAYLAGGLTGEWVGLVWEPVGGGNSVAIAGLAGLMLAGVPFVRNLPLPVRLVWPVAGLLLAVGLTAASNIHGPPFFAGAAVALIAWMAGLKPAYRSLHSSPKGKTT